MVLHARDDGVVIALIVARATQAPHARAGHDFVRISESKKQRVGPGQCRERKLVATNLMIIMSSSAHVWGSWYLILHHALLLAPIDI